MSSKTKKSHKASDSSASDAKAKSKKSKSSKSAHSGSANLKKLVEVEKAIVDLIKRKPKHYSARRLAKKLEETKGFSADLVRAAVVGLKGKDVMEFDRVSKPGSATKKSRLAYLIAA